MQKYSDGFTDINTANSVTHMIFTSKYLQKSYILRALKQRNFSVELQIKFILINLL